jgi:DNA-binding transcriptional MerR regulator/methylmalonyl-CoA mutase cobalamin-binding subunit
MSEARLPIKMVAQRTGLSAHVIRIWEKRYGAVEPERTETNRRLYSPEQIERLILLRELTEAGHSIGHAAKLRTEQLRELASQRSTTSSPGKPLSFLDEAVAAVKSLDSHRLEDVLKRAELALGGQGMLQRLIGPLAATIGDLWRDGTITAAHEHFASAIIRVFLGQASKPFAGTEGAPVLVVATPAGQIHELGALLVGAAAANLGWHVTYLGASLPAVEIAGAARQNRARAIALSLVYPEDDPRLEGELIRLHESIPEDVTVLVGGRAVPAYREILSKVGAIEVKDLVQFASILDLLRKTKGKKKR